MRHSLLDTGSLDYGSVTALPIQNIRIKFRRKGHRIGLGTMLQNAISILSNSYSQIHFYLSSEVYNMSQVTRSTK